MFPLVKSKQEIKKEIGRNLPLLIRIMIIPIILIILGIMAGSFFQNDTIEKLAPLWLILMLISILGPVSMTYTGIQFNRTDDYKEQANGIFPNISTDEWVGVILINLISGVLTLLWTFLFIIPGMIKSYAYSQAVYIWLDAKHSGENIGYMEAITRSRKLMVGNKWKMFALAMSFMGWIILGSIVLGMGANWITWGGVSLIIGIPVFIVAVVFYTWLILYMTYTMGSFYEAIKKTV